MLNVNSNYFQLLTPLTHVFVVGNDAVVLKLCTHQLCLLPVKKNQLSFDCKIKILVVFGLERFGFKSC